MAKIYYRRYLERINNGEITVLEAVELARTEVPSRWREAVIALLSEEV